ncbi:MAG TPA: hypothetical protein VFQ53_30400 [Kofleriaceae bacterium]|nr:hypothetical protein [Kofleriaceae bacterium]
MKRLIAIAVVLVAAPAHADNVSVKVIEVAGGVAYVSPGRAAGLVHGTKVVIRGRTYEVVESTEKTAALALDRSTLAVGDTGTATVTPGAAAAVDKLPKPRPPEAFRDQWPDPVPPATTQQVTPVPLGSGRAPGRARVTVIGHGFGTGDRSGVAGSAEARVISSFELSTERPLGADLDVAGRVFSRSIDSRTHVPVYVRAAQLRYGDPRDPRLALGRLRYAASSVGMLDGGRASARIGNVAVAAFGGIVPDPLGGKPDPDASRFGGELAYDAPASSWQPRLAVTAYGSTWQGALDERRASVVASANHASLSVDGWAELQSFAAGNPWGAAAIELTGAGGALQWRSHGTHAGVDVSFLRPERSLRMDAYLPPDWLCTRVPQPGDVDEACGGSDDRTTASGSLGTRTSRFAVDAVATIGRSRGIATDVDSSGYLRGELYAGPGRIQVGGAAGRTSFAAWTAGELGVGFASGRTFDASVAYRLEQLDYVAASGPVTLHSIVGDARHSVSTELDVALSALATTGVDRDALAALVTIAWRPLP